MTRDDTAHEDESACDAFTAVPGRADAPIFLTCEHASERIPAPWALAGEDARLVGTHWAFDLGARDVTIELAAALGASAVVSEFSRLLVDPNREEDSPTLFRELAEGRPIRLNAAVSARDREARLTRFYRPFHEAIDRAARACAAPVLLSVHSFTPLYEGSPRHMEIGVLFNREEALAERIGDALRRGGFRVAMNEPWSGRDGLIYSAEHHADAHGKAALELEIRQDLAVDPRFRARLVAEVAAFFRA